MKELMENRIKELMETKTKEELATELVTTTVAFNLVRESIPILQFSKDTIKLNKEIKKNE